MIPVVELVSLLRQKFDEKIKETADPIINGDAESFEDYLRWSGKIAGIRDARQILDDLLKQLNEAR